MEMKDRQLQFHAQDQQSTGKEENLSALMESVYRSYLSHQDECQEQYNLAEDPDIGRIYEAVLDKNIQNMLFSKVSVLIITANKYEKNVLHANLFGKNGQKIKRIRITLWARGEHTSETYAYYFHWQGYHVLHLEAQTTGSYTLGGAADLVRYALENPYLYPTVVVSLGICFGIDETKQSIGDTILSDKVYPYFMAAKITEKGLFVSDDNMFRFNPQLHTKIKSEIIDLNVFKVLKFDADFGNYITGEAVVSNQAMRDCFADTTTQTVRAGDMEGYGLFKECFSRGHTVPCLTIKSICDWGACKNFTDEELFQKAAKKEYAVSPEFLRSIKDQLQAYAAYNAFQVLDLLLEHSVFETSVYDHLIPKVREMQKNREMILYNRGLNRLVDETACQVLGRTLNSSVFVKSVLQCLIDDKILQDNGEQTYSIISGGRGSGK